MNMWKRTLAAAMSLALCAGMVSPAFAASFRELQGAIDDADHEYANGEQIGESDHYGYAATGEGDDKRYGIEAWSDENGKRNVRLNEDVVYDPEEAPSADPQSVYVGAGQDVNLDLNGHDIKGTSDKDVRSSGEAIIIVEDAADDGSAVAGKLTVTGEGNITDGKGGVKVEAGASLAVGENVEISGNGNYDVFLDYEAAENSDPSNTDESAGIGAALTGGNWKDSEEKSYSGTIEATKETGPLSLTFALRDSSEPDDDGGENRPPVEPDKPAVDPDKPAVEPDKPVAVPDDPIVVPDVSDNSGSGPEEPDDDWDGSDNDAETSGKMTGAELIDYLWRHEKEPEAVSAASANAPADPRYADAIAWGQSIGLLEDIDGAEIDLDEPVTVLVIRTILTRFAAWKGMEMPELTKLSGRDDAVVPNCREVLDEFFGED